MSIFISLVPAILETESIICVFKELLCINLLSCFLQSRTPLLQSLIGLFELPEDDSIPDEEHFIDIEDTPGYQTAFSQLAFAGKKEHDPVGQMVTNPKIHLAQSLHKLSTACPGRVSIKYLCDQ